MQRTTLKVKMSNGKVLSDSAETLLCALEQLGCETTSSGPYAYNGTTLATAFCQSF